MTLTIFVTEEAEKQLKDKIPEQELFKLLNTFQDLPQLFLDNAKKVPNEETPELDSYLFTYNKHRLLFALNLSNQNLYLCGVLI